MDLLILYEVIKHGRLMAIIKLQLLSTVDLGLQQTDDKIFTEVQICQINAINMNLFLR